MVDDGGAILWAARQTDDQRDEDWSIHCGANGHATDDMRVVHLAHLVRSSPALRRIADLALDEEAWRDDNRQPLEAGEAGRAMTSLERPGPSGWSRSDLSTTVDT